MSDKRTYEISTEEYESLLADSVKLQVLEAYGVDNWEGYDRAMQEYWKKAGE